MAHHRLQAASIAFRHSLALYPAQQTELDSNQNCQGAAFILSFGSASFEGTQQGWQMAHISHNGQTCQVSPVHLRA